MEFKSVSQFACSGKHGSVKTAVGSMIRSKQEGGHGGEGKCDAARDDRFKNKGKEYLAASAGLAPVDACDS